MVEGGRGGAGALLKPKEVEVLVLETAEAVAVWGEWWWWWQCGVGEWDAEPGREKVRHGGVSAE